RASFGAGTVAVTVAYALGAAIPMLAVAALGQRATSRIRANAPALRTALGVVFNLDQKLQTWFPDYTHALQGLERTSVARKELATLQHRGPSPFKATAAASGLPDYGQAPDFAGITSWLHSKPLTMSRLRGKVVLVDFWTYSCINC